MRLGSGAYEGRFSFASRFEEGPGTNPEELIAAAHAGCFSMFLTATLGKAGHTDTQVSTTARIHLEAGPTITRIELETEARVPGLDDAAFQELARTAKEGCPVSKALAAVEITLAAKLV
jgi:osmotically inducible protein OsmC